jgi:hypothetical protein
MLPPGVEFFFHYFLQFATLCPPCVGVGKLFGWFWLCDGFLVRPDNVLDYEALAIILSF